MLTIVEGLASALDALHGAGIVHRDVKPQNVLLSPSGPKLADLGVIRLGDVSDPASALTASGATPGTIRYLAPELIFGKPAGAKADAFGLAMVAYEALTGRSPRPAATLGDLVETASHPPSPISDARPELGGAYNAVFAGGLDVDPGRRLAPQAFAAALREALSTSREAPVGGASDAVPLALSGVARPNPTAVGADAEATTFIDPSAPTAIGEPDDSTDRWRAPARPSTGGLGVSLGWIVAGVGLLLVLAVLLRLGGGTSPPPGGAGLGSSPSGPAATTTATPQATDPEARVRDALAGLRRAAGALEGGEAEDFGEKIDEVEKALTDDDRDKAIEKARDLADRVDELIREDKVGGASAEELRRAARALLEALGVREGDR